MLTCPLTLRCAAKRGLIRTAGYTCINPPLEMNIAPRVREVILHMCSRKNKSAIIALIMKDKGLIGRGRMGWGWGGLRMGKQVLSTDFFS